MTRLAGSSLFLLFVIAACGRGSEKPVDTGATAPPTSSLPASVPGLGTLAGEIAAPLGEIADVHELPDGRVLVIDRAERTLVVADFVSGKVTTVGGHGGGPHEYGKFIESLIPYRADTVWMPDGENMRFAIVSPKGEIVNSVAPRFMPPVVAGIRDADTIGNVYMVGWGQADSVSLQRSPVAGGPSTPVLKLSIEPLRKTKEEVEASGETVMVTHEISPNQWTDGYAVYPNGDVIVARARPFHLERIEAAGKRTVGPAIAYDPFPLTDSISKRFGIKAKPPIFPLTYDQPSAAPDGSFWIRRTVKADNAPPEYDVFDHSLTFVRHVVLPATTSLLAVGKKHVYLAHETPEGPRLVRYAF